MEDGYNGHYCTRIGDADWADSGTGPSIGVRPMNDADPLEHYVVAPNTKVASLRMGVRHYSAALQRPLLGTLRQRGSLPNESDSADVITYWPLLSGVGLTGIARSPLHKKSGAP